MQNLVVELLNELGASFFLLPQRSTKKIGCKQRFQFCQLAMALAARTCKAATPATGTPAVKVCARLRGGTTSAFEPPPAVAVSRPLEMSASSRLLFNQISTACSVRQQTLPSSERKCLDFAEARQNCKLRLFTRRSQLVRGAINLLDLD